MTYNYIFNITNDLDINDAMRACGLWMFTLYNYIKIQQDSSLTDTTNNGGGIINCC